MASILESFKEQLGGCSTNVDVESYLVATQDIQRRGHLMLMVSTVIQMHLFITYPPGD